MLSAEGLGVVIFLIVQPASAYCGLIGPVAPCGYGIAFLLLVNSSLVLESNGGSFGYRVTASCFSIFVEPRGDYPSIFTTLWVHFLAVAMLLHDCQIYVGF